MTIDHLGRLENVHAFVLPRTEEQREYVRGLELPSVILPETAVDAQSLIALADLVVSAGGTMIREAAVLGTPVWSIFEGRPGAVDEQLAREGRIQFLRDPAELVVAKATERRPVGRRDPADLLRLAVPLYN
jgi:predicted glycosyltransferase